MLTGTAKAVARLMRFAQITCLHIRITAAVPGHDSEISLIFKNF